MFSQYPWRRDVRMVGWGGLGCSTDSAHPKNEGWGQSHPQQPLGGSSDGPLIAYAVFMYLSQTPGMGGLRKHTCPHKAHLPEHWWQHEPALEATMEDEGVPVRFPLSPPPPQRRAPPSCHPCPRQPAWVASILSWLEEEGRGGRYLILNRCLSPGFCRF